MGRHVVCNGHCNKIRPEKQPQNDHHQHLPQPRQKGELKPHRMAFTAGLSKGDGYFSIPGCLQVMLVNHYHLIAKGQLVTD